MTNRYYRVMLGRKSAHADECRNGGFIGVDFGIDEDLTLRLPENWRDFNAEYIPIYLKNRPQKSKIAAGLACGNIWVVAKGMATNDIVLSPDGRGNYMVGRVTGDYHFAPNSILFHRRHVQWLDLKIPRGSMSDSLKNACGIPATVIELTQYAAEIESLISGESREVQLPTSNSDAGDPLSFALESHLEEFLIRNWDQTELGKDYAIYSEDGELVGQQYATDAGTIDILALSRDGQKLLVVELKRHKADDAAVGQILRYMGYVQDQLASEGQQVEGVIIGFEDNSKLRWALKLVPSIKFLRYRIDFALLPLDDVSKN